jgi:hypothetical protein
MTVYNFIMEHLKGIYTHLFMMEKTYLLLASIMVMLVFTLIHIYHLKPTLAQTSVPPTKMNLTNATSMNTTAPGTNATGSENK